MSFLCPSCRTDRQAVPTCPDCGTHVRYRTDDVPALRDALDGDVWAALPDVGTPVSMGEGTTPIVELDRVSSELGIQVFGMLESLNPTCSFKDRGSALAVSAVADPSTSHRAIVVASTGNTATSVAAYAARADVPCAILVPDGTAAPKLAQAAAHGADVFTVDGDFSECFDRAQKVSGDRILNATAVYSATPYVAAADRTVAFELAGRLDGVPEWVSVPVGAGPLLGGTDDGFADLERAGLVDRTPSMLCVQSHGCHPVVEAYESDRPVTAWQEPITTDVGALADPLRGYPEDGERTRQSVLRSDGDAIALQDEVVHEWTDRLATWEGVYAEPASAASVAAVAESEVVTEGPVVALITGHGLKESDDQEMSWQSGGTVDAVRTALVG